MKGIGADVVSVSRLERSMSRSAGLAESVFTRAERSDCDARRAPGRHYAARFAAKEAFLKALGLGLWDGVSLRDIEVRRGPAGALCLALGPTAAAALSRSGGAAPLLSIGHDGDAALAMVVVP
jgi:holo-[acyl-carrier protein] synthase